MKQEQGCSSIFSTELRVDTKLLVMVVLLEHFCDPGEILSALRTSVNPLGK